MPNPELTSLAAEARAFLRGRVHRTPLVTCRTLDEITGATVFVKAEGLQRTGSFKVRGALFAARAARAAGADALVAYSSGNHAAAIAYAGRWAGLAVTVLMPHDAPLVKVGAAEEYGATVVHYDRYADDRSALAVALAERCGAVVVPSADSPHIVAGASTVAAELLDDAGTLDAIVVPVGGGGLLAGAVVAAPGHVDVVGVEPEASRDLADSLAAGRRLEVPVGITEADGLQLATVAPLAWQVAAPRARAVVVDELAIATALRFAVDRLKLVAEPSAVVGLAALLAGASGLTGRRVGVVLTGANVGCRRLGSLLVRSRPAESL